MITQPKVEVRGEQLYAAIRLQVSVPFGAVVVPSNQAVNAWLASRGLAPSGAPFIRYLTTDMARKLDIEIGWPVASAVAGDERISTGVFPAGRYATLNYFGPYDGDGLMKATAALLEWAKENHVTWKTSTIDNIEWWEARIENYLTDPGNEPDPQKWQTELAFLVSDS